MTDQSPTRPREVAEWTPAFPGQRPPFQPGNTEGRKAKGKPKSLRRIARAAAFKIIPGTDRETLAKQVVDALVSKALTGDVAAIKEYRVLVDGPDGKVHQHEHRLRRDLVVLPDGDARCLPVERADEPPMRELPPPPDPPITPGVA